VASSCCFLLLYSVVDPLVDSKPIGMHACCFRYFPPLDRLFFLGLRAFPEKNLPLVGVEGCTND